MKDIVKSNKMKGLEILESVGANVPKYSFIPDFETLGIDYSALNPKFKVPSIKQAIEAALMLIGDVDFGYSLRSASFDEDDSTISSAGKYTSFNGLSTIDELYHAAISIWKDHRSKTKNNILCPLILQETHCSYYSGVLFREKSDDTEITVIESYYGSNKTVVDGMALPYRSKCIDGIWDHEFNSDRTACYRFYAHSGLFEPHERNILPGSILKSKFEGFPNQVRKYTETYNKEYLVYAYRKPDPPDWYLEKICGELVELARKLDSGSGVDIEWGADSKGNLYLYQFRPLTSSLLAIKETSVPDVKCQLTGNIIKGIPASPGFCRGSITNNPTSDKVNILMLQNAQISDIKQLEPYAGVVSVFGGMLSHLAIVCRELNLPCVVGIQTNIPESTQIEMDACSGVIQIID